MSIQLHELPVDLFPENLQFYIKRLNMELRQIAALEGVLHNPITPNRSDASIVRLQSPQVDISRITPEPAMAISVSGSTTTIGTPALTLGTANAAGSTTTVISINSTIALFGLQAAVGLSNNPSVGSSAFAARADHVHEFPYALQTQANSATITATDDGNDTFLIGSLGSLRIQAANVTTIHPGTSNPATVAIVTGDPDNGQTTLLAPQWSSGAISGTTVRCWDAQPVGSGVFTGGAIVGYDTTAFSIGPILTSDNANRAYCARLSGPNISNANAGWTEIAALVCEAPRRTTISAFTVSTCGTIIAECPTIGGVTQAGLIIRQRTAQVTATNRYGIFVDAQNSGTNRYAFYGVSDILHHGGTLRHVGLLVGLYGATPTIQFGTSGTASGHSVTTGTTVTHTDVFSGNTGTNSYTIGDVVRALKVIGALAY